MANGQATDRQEPRRKGRRERGRSGARLEGVVGQDARDVNRGGVIVRPFIAVALWQAADGSTFLVGMYLSGAAVITLISLFLTKETKDMDYEGLSS